jgi:8-oxo-dGTP diphosphatase
MLEVALAMLERDGRWLVQLRDDIPGIVAPGCWGLFGGHLDPGESPDQALRRELQEEINWCAGDLPFWFRHSTQQRTAHFFRASLPLPLDDLQLLEGQDMVLAGIEELVTGQIWSPRLQQVRPLAQSLQLALENLRRIP